MVEHEKELKSPLMKVKEESEKAGLKVNIQKIKIMASGPITSWQVEGKKVEAVTDFLFLSTKISVGGDCSQESRRHLLPWKEGCEKPRQHSKKQRHHFANKGPHSQNCGLSSGHVQLWEPDHREDWALKNWCFWTVVLEKTSECPLDREEIKPVNYKTNQPWILIGRTDTEALKLWPQKSKQTFLQRSHTDG